MDYCLDFKIKYELLRFSNFNDNLFLQLNVNIFYKSRIFRN
jgi:hypothetical protein